MRKLRIYARNFSKKDGCGIRKSGRPISTRSLSTNGDFKKLPVVQGDFSLFSLMGVVIQDDSVLPDDRTVSCHPPT